MSRITHKISIVCFLFAIAFAMSPSVCRGGEPVRVFTVPSGGRSGVSVLLPDTLGTAKASGPVARPDSGASRVADALAVVDSGSRGYGKVTIDVFRLADEPLAYALLRFLRPANGVTIDAGDDAWETADTTAVRSGAFSVVLRGGDRAARLAAAREIAGRIGQRPVETALVRKLPADGLVAGSERYAGSLESVRRIRPDISEDTFRFGAGGADAVIGDYDLPGGATGHLLIVEYQTPQLAADAERSVIAYYAVLPAEAKSSRFFKREGNYLIEGTADGDIAALRARADQVVYAYGVKWIGEEPETILKLSNEAQKAALVFINSFAIVGAAFAGAIVCGLIVGVVVFRRRRRAAAAVFSDAGGMVHLQLGSAHLTSADAAIGLLTEKSGS